MKELKELSKAIDRLYGLYAVNHEVMEEDDVKDLLGTIDSLRAMHLAKYKKQVKEFVDYLRNDFPDAGDNAAWSKFVETPYVITHGDKTVIVENYADVYDGLFTLLKDHLEDLG